MCNVRPSDGELHEAAALARLASLCLATFLVGSTSSIRLTGTALLLSSWPYRSELFAVADMSLPETAYGLKEAGKPRLWKHKTMYQLSALLLHRSIDT